MYTSGDKKRTIERLQKFLAKMRKTKSAEFFHYGDLIFRICKTDNHFSWEKDIKIWEDKGEIVGFAFYTAPDINPDYMINPDYYPQIFHEAVRWSEERAKADGSDRIETGCIEGDELKRQYLLEAGFQPIDDPMVFMVYHPEEDVSEVVMPDGYTLETAEEKPELYGIDQEDTKENYERMTTAPGYMDEMGIRVVYNKETIAGGCIAWLDKVDRTAEFEPVGIVDEHRKKGLAYCVMAEIIKRLKAHGVKSIYVRTSADNLPAVKLYEKLGFRIVKIDQGFEKLLNNH